MAWQSLEALIEIQRRRTPDAIAIDASSFNNQKISYSELEDLVSALVKSLSRHAISRGDRVVLVCQYKVNAIVAYLALFRLGMTVIPLDFHDKDARREEMTASLDVRWCLTDISANLAADEVANNYIFIESNPCKLKHDKNPDFIFFSSGSSNKPKAIGGCHQALYHYINWQINFFNLQAGMRYSQFTLLHYDACLRDIFTPLCSGGSICLPNDNSFSFSANELNQWLVKNKINVVNTVPSIFSLLVTSKCDRELSKTLKYLFLAGEKINTGDLKEWYECNGDRTQLVNLYGATETLMTKLFYVIAKEDIFKKTIPVGIAMEQVEVQIKSGQVINSISDVDGVGEIKITVPYILPGYINHDNKGIFEFDYQRQLTHYNTGDLGKINELGMVEFVGRNDRQIKINGVRLDLDEVEATFVNHEQVKQCAAIFNDKIVSVFIVLQKNALSVSSLNKLLLDKFSTNFSAIQMDVIEKLPLTKTGKIDYQFLSRLKKQSNKKFSTNSNKSSLSQDDDLISLKLQLIWTEVLRLDDQYVADKNQNFFEAGGDSLSALQFISVFESTFNVKISIAEFLNHANIEQLEKLLRKQKLFVNSPIVALNSADNEQPRFWCLHAPGGSIVPYATLARKFKHYAFMGIQYPSFCGDPDIVSIENMADYYMKHMLSLTDTVKEKPFYLGAWSSGSLFALELAERLIQQGYQVPVVIMIDSPFHFRQNENVRQYQIRAFLSIFNNLAQGLDISIEQNKLELSKDNLKLNSNKFFIMNLVASHFLDIQFEKQELVSLILPLQITDILLKDFLKIKPWLISILPKRLLLKLSPARRERLILFFIKLRRGTNKNLNKDNFLQYMDVFRNNMRAVFKYRPKKINVKQKNTRYILLSQEKSPDLSGWQQLGYDVECKHIEGNHFTLFKEPYVSTLAKIIEHELSCSVSSAVEKING